MLRHSLFALHALFLRPTWARCELLGITPGASAASVETLQRACAALAAAVAGLGVASVLPPWHPILEAVAILGVFGGGYLGLARVLGADSARRA